MNRGRGFNIAWASFRAISGCTKSGAASCCGDGSMPRSPLQPRGAGLQALGFCHSPRPGHFPSCGAPALPAQLCNLPCPRKKTSPPACSEVFLAGGSHICTGPDVHRVLCKAQAAPSCSPLPASGEVTREVAVGGTPTSPTPPPRAQLALPGTSHVLLH